MFGRKKQQDETPSPVQERPQREGAKNRPTPKRRDQEAARKRPLVQADRKSAKAADREARRTVPWRYAILRMHEQVEQLVSRIVRQLESLGETEIPSSTVGDFIMKALKSVDEVAYVRYASVYKDFRHTGDFAKFLGDEGFDEPSGKV